MYRSATGGRKWFMYTVSGAKIARQTVQGSKAPHLQRKGIARHAHRMVPHGHTTIALASHV